MRYPLRGIDVSHHQGTIDWAQVAADDVAFAYVKVSEGGDHRDRLFARNIGEANRFGLPVGAYHFFTFCRPAVDQARNFVDAVAANITRLPPMVDLEFHGNCDRRPSPEEMGREVAAYLDIVERELGRAAIYYAPDHFLEIYGDALPPRRLWRRSILREPEQADWIIWQYNATGRVAGSDGDVDLNVLSVTLGDLIGSPDGPRGAADQTPKD
jgi:lysozyme